MLKQHSRFAAATRNRTIPDLAPFVPAGWRITPGGRSLSRSALP